MRLCKSSLITKLLLLAVMIYAIAMVMTLQPEIDQPQQQRDELAAQVTDAQQKNLELAEDIERIGTDEAIIEIARERLNLVEDGEIVFIDSGK